MHLLSHCVRLVSAAGAVEIRLGHLQLTCRVSRTLGIRLEFVEETRAESDRLHVKPEAGQGDRRSAASAAEIDREVVSRWVQAQRLELMAGLSRIPSHATSVAYAVLGQV